MKVSGNRKTALPFPSFNTYKGWISITDFHGGAMPICQPSGYKNTANGLFAVLAFRLCSMLNTTKVARIIETATKNTTNLAVYLNLYYYKTPNYKQKGLEAQFVNLNIIVLQF